MATNWLNIAVWSLLGTWVLVVGTLILMYWQTRTSQRLNSANAVMSLRERFDSPHMRTARRHLAQRMLAQGGDDLSSAEVATFFELVGTLTHLGVLEPELVWEAFGSWVTSYWWSLRHPVDWVGQIRTDLADPLVFHEFEWLNRRVLELDRRALAKLSSAPGNAEEEARRILSREALLESI